MPVTPYLFFDGRCEEALDFYKKALGAKVEMMMRYKESPEPPPPGMVPAGSENKIMHSCFRVGDAPVGHARQHAHPVARELGAVHPARGAAERVAEGRSGALEHGHGDSRL